MFWHSLQTIRLSYTYHKCMTQLYFIMWIFNAMHICVEVLINRLYVYLHDMPIDERVEMPTCMQTR